MRLYTSVVMNTIVDLLLPLVKLLGGEKKNRIHKSRLIHIHSTLPRLLKITKIPARDGIICDILYSIFIIRS